MNLSSDIQSEQTALARIVAGLFALLGLTAGQLRDAAPQRILRSLHSAIGLVLRPAESAVRRLIYILSLDLRSEPLPVRPMPTGIVRAGAACASSAFKLFDPPLRLVRRLKKVRAAPRISFFGDGEVRTLALGAPADDANSDGLIASTQILRRLEALRSALDDLPRQARRLVRARQRRSRSRRLISQKPLRPGYPPGHRQRRKHEIDDVLRRCHERARDALPPDTS